MAGPDLWFSLAIFGISLIYWEAFRPGLFFPVIAGVFLLILGGWHLALLPFTATGAGLLAVAVACYLSELIKDTWFVAGIAGTIALAIGMMSLFASPVRIDPALAVLGSLVVGPPTALLMATARKARRNKRLDLDIHSQK